ncbi:LysM peptidoglycan-binding domain-containing protein [Saccharothrix sp. 6-C]|uniref:LysM domain-containing protein n=1 Tax=Saccharothrix texasensis TaxID=103734 RepID=A0A3N1H515_9PSEU|nr:LysM peptidoglycan-binding domain-containing protein [Saccharothrix texasensis]QQQ77908.1 LysM peptidoglycan-binding domain-containing protein [Saccharothrix sp. 6-C]ROP37624.1 LysM domain-containing protein [Saccharothrix texasensis]
MAVVIGTRNSFELVDGAGAEDVALGAGLRPGPRVLRRFDVHDKDNRRPSTRPRPLAVRPTAPEPIACEVRPRRHPAVQFAGYATAAALFAALLSLLFLYSSGATTVPERTNVVHVQVGESLWDVAERSAPASDPDAVVARIRELNSLPGSDVVPGQALVVPHGT